MPNFWKHVNSVIKDADIILEVLDARNVDDTRNREIEDKVRESGKILIPVINKCDLTSREKLEKYKKKLPKAVYISSKEYHGMKILRERIYIEAHKKNILKPKVGILGYPNVGKSSLVNALKGSGSAQTSSQSGFTKGVQKVKAHRITLLDTPGVIPYKEKEVMKHAIIGAIDFTKLKDPEGVVFALLTKFPDLLQDFYKVKGEDEEFLENFAVKKKLLKKGSKTDVHRAAVMIMQDWQKGRITV